MHKYIFIALVIALALGFASSARAQQQSGTELKFENVEEIRNRPSDIHIGSDPEYRPGMEKQIGGSDEGGYEKDNVERDREYYEEKTYYKRVDDKENNPPPSRWD